MFFKTEQEEKKFKENKEKELKIFEKLEKKLFSDINQIYEEVINKPSNELRVVLHANKDDLLAAYFETLSSKKEDEDKFCEIFKFVFSDSKLTMVKSDHFLKEDFKTYLNIAIDKKYIRGIDNVVALFEDKINIKNQFSFALLSSLEYGNSTLLEFLLKKQGEDGKLSKCYFEENLLFSDPYSLNFVHNMNVYQLSESFIKNINILYKQVAFNREDYLTTLTSKLKIWSVEVDELLRHKNKNSLINKCVSICDILLDMNEETISNIVQYFNEKNQANNFFKIVSLFNKIPEIYKDRKNIVFFNIHKEFLNFADNEKKVALINKSFSNFESNYSNKEKEEIKKFKRENFLNSLVKKEVVEDVKLVKKKI